MNQEQIVHKVKEMVHALKEKIRHEHKTASSVNELNEYDKMRVESLLKKEMENKLRKPNLEPGNNRDISAI